MLERSRWQREQDEKNANALKPLPGFQNWQRSGQYSGGQIGFEREGRWWKRASESEYSGSGKWGFKKEAA